jgi:hypothetical protein
MAKQLAGALSVRTLQQVDSQSLAKLLTAAPDDGTLYSFLNVPKYPLLSEDQIEKLAPKDIARWYACSILKPIETQQLIVC